MSKEIQTVTGPIAPEALGKTLPEEGDRGLRELEDHGDVISSGGGDPLASIRTNGSPVKVLSATRVLDLSEERGIFCSFVLGELGADVVCVERVASADSRRSGPCGRRTD